MRFALDPDDRFMLTAVDGGWELEVDGQRVHYCRDPLAALHYLAEELREKTDVDGVAQVVAALDHIDQTLAKVVEVVNLEAASARLHQVISARLSPSGSRREHIRHTSLALADLDPGDELMLRARPDARDIVTKAKAILEPWWDDEK